MSLHLGIGPHEGRELELMLKGEKKCALFHAALPNDGVIPEEAIPENAFAPYVGSGQILRFAKDYHCAGHQIRYVCFTEKDEAWRAQFLFWLKERFFRGDRIDGADDVLEGRVLSYSEADISAYRNNHDVSIT